MRMKLSLAITTLPSYVVISVSLVLVLRSFWIGEVLIRQERRLNMNGLIILKFYEVEKSEWESQRCLSLDNFKQLPQHTI
jgi:hypothetical protein